MPVVYAHMSVSAITVSLYVLIVILANNDANRMSTHTYRKCVRTPTLCGSKKLRLHAPLVNTRLQVRATVAEYRPGPCQERAIKTIRVVKRKPSAISTLCPAALSRSCKVFYHRLR